MDTNNHKIILEIIFLKLIQYIVAFRPEIQMPYKVISGTSTAEINKIGSTLTCDEQRNSLQDCANECFNRSLTTTGCPGFYTDTTENNICHLCHVTNIAEVEVNAHTTFGSNDHIYLLKTKTVNPEVSLSFDNYTGETVYGENVVGTASGVVESDHVAGIKGEGLYLHDGNNVHLTGSGTECWTNLLNCSSGMTVSLWCKTTELIYSYIAGSGTQFQQGFTLRMHPHKVEFWVDLLSGRQVVTPFTVLTVGQWFLLTGTFHEDKGVDFYVNSLPNPNQYRGNATSQINQVDWAAHLGVKDAIAYNVAPAHGTLDEFKYYYRVLNSVEIWREYIGYDLDLDLPSVILSPDLVSNGNDYTELVDGNLATCATLANPMQVKLWNSASNKANYTVTVVTENLPCLDNNFDGLVIYGEQQNLLISEKIGNEAHSQHFIGQFSMMSLESKSENNGQNECVFRHICEDMCYYVFISVLNIPDNGVWNICEVVFL